MSLELTFNVELIEKDRSKGKFRYWIELKGCVLAEKKSNKRFKGCYFYYTTEKSYIVYLFTESDYEQYKQEEEVKENCTQLITNVYLLVGGKI